MTSLLFGLVLLCSCRSGLGGQPTDARFVAGSSARADPGGVMYGPASGRSTTISPRGVVQQPAHVLGGDARPVGVRGGDHDPVKALARDRLTQRMAVELRPRAIRASTPTPNRKARCSIASCRRTQTLPCRGSAAGFWSYSDTRARHTDTSTACSALASRKARRARPLTRLRRQTETGSVGARPVAAAPHARSDRAIARRRPRRAPPRQRQ